MFYLQGRSTGTIGWIRLLELFLYPRPNLVGACLEMVTRVYTAQIFLEGSHFYKQALIGKIILDGWTMHIM
jgi:hypothetical protein